MYDSQGRYAEAEPLFLRAVAIWETALGPDHPATFWACDACAIFLAKMGRKSDAAAMRKRAAAGRAAHEAKNKRV
jgi:hypothetical protein